MWDNVVMAGRVKTDFANVNYVKDLCQTPIRTDREYSGSTCLQIEHAGQGFHNYQRVGDIDVQTREICTDFVPYSILRTGIQRLRMAMVPQPKVNDPLVLDSCMRIRQSLRNGKNTQKSTRECT